MASMLGVQPRSEEAGYELVAWKEYQEEKPTLQMCHTGIQRKPGTSRSCPDPQKVPDTALHGRLPDASPQGECKRVRRPQCASTDVVSVYLLRYVGLGFSL